MDDNKIVLSIWEYTSLIKLEAKIEALERLIRQTNYVSVDDIKAILDIVETEGNTNG